MALMRAATLALNQANENLEQRVAQRTTELSQTNAELGAEVEECSLPLSVAYGLACYYLIAPAEASPAAPAARRRPPAAKTTPAPPKKRRIRPAAR